MRRLRVARPAGRRTAPDRRRRHGQRRDRRRARRRRCAARTPLDAVEILADGRRRRTRSSSPARTPSGTPSPIGSRSPRRTSCPRRCAGRAAVRPRPRQPAVRPARRDGRAAARRPRSSRPRRSTAAPTGSRSSAGSSTSSPGRWPADGVALLEIGADQGEAIVDARRGAAAGLVVRGGRRPRGPAAGGADRARLRHGPGIASVRGRQSGSIAACPSSGRPTRSCPSASSRSTSTGRSSATT